MIDLATVEVAGFTIAETLSGLFSLVLLPLIGWWVRRLILKYEAGHVETQAGQAAIAAASDDNYAALDKRLGEAEALIRGDLANGIKKKLDQIGDHLTSQDVAAEKRD